MNRQLFSILVVFSIFGLAVATDDGLGHPRSSVYAKPGDGQAAVIPAETLENLKILRLRGLIEVSEISPDKCGTNYLSVANDLIDTYSEFSVNLVPYLMHYRDEQTRLCNYPEV